MDQTILDLVACVTAPLGELSDVLVGQAAVAQVVACSPTVIDVVTPEDAVSVDLDDGPTPGRALVYSEGQLVGEVLVWIRAGRIIGLEQAWYTDVPPSRWPSRAEMRVT